MPQQSQGTVLFVDDDEANRNTFALIFREAGFDVKEAATGGEALRLAADKPDLIILDVNLPDMDGFKVCRHIKAHPATTAIPVMHISGVYVTSEDRTHALDDGADVYLTKPVEPREMVAQARVLLRIHQAEARAAAAVGQWQATFAAIHEGVCVVDRQGRVLRCNKATERLLQRPSSEILGHNHDDLMPARPRSGEPSVFGRMLHTRRGEMAELPVGERWLQVIADPLFAEGAIAGAVSILSDVTDRKRLEEQLRQSHKMEALGRLANGIAHDFNNLLTVVAGNVWLLLTATPEDDPDRELLLAVERAAWRAAGLTRELLGFSHRSAARLEPIDLRASLDEVAALLRRTIDPQITLEVRSAGGLWTVRADPSQINQVLMNLCLNARDAMPEGGLLLLEADNAVLEGQPAGSARHRAGEFVRLRVRDSGLGIAPDVLPHLFEPFFTTKEPGKGTGLGLATVYGIVSQHQGWVDCSSAVNEGACFDVYLPRCGEIERPRPTGPLAAELRGTETILLAEDDALVRALGSLILRRYGYEVLAVEDGELVVDLYRQDQHRIGLVILDSNLPRLSWRDTLGRLLQVNPRVRVLLAAGDSEEAIEPDTEGILGFLTKPYRVEDLAATVRKALDRRRGETDLGGQREPPAPPSGPGQGAEPPKPDEAPGIPKEEPPPPGQECRSGLTRAEAEGLLDWLEVHGTQGQLVLSEADKSFAVVWQQDARPAAAPSGRCRRRRREPCPACGSAQPPFVVREMAPLSWVLVGCGVLLWPLLIVGLRLRRDVWRCWDCRCVLGRGRLTMGR